MTSTILIPVFTGTLQNKSVQLCNARDLHAFLQVGKDFSTWIKDRIATYGFISDEDYATAEILSSPKLGSSKARRQRMTDYHLTLDTAKELSMVENNEQGRMARRYFIAQEKLAQIGQAQPVAEPAALLNHHHITTAQASEISTLVCTFFPDSIDRHLAWKQFNANFKISTYKRLPSSKFVEALVFIETCAARQWSEKSNNAGSQIDLAALSRQVAEYLMDGQRDETLSIDQKTLIEIEALLSKTIMEFNSLPNSSIYSNVYNVLCMVKKLIKNGGSLKGSYGALLRFDAPKSKLTAQSELVRFMRESALVCVEIGLYEIEAAAGHDAGQIRTGEIAKVMAKAMRNRPEHMADIQMVSGWMHAEAQCTEAQREGVRMHWLSVAQSIEDALS